MKETDQAPSGTNNMCDKALLFWRYFSRLAFTLFSSRFLFMAVLLCLQIAAANSQQLHLQHFTVDDGLPSNEVYQVLQDSSQNLVVATDRGAVKYDGYSFADVPLENGRSGKPVYYIYKTPDGGIYFSGLQG